MEDKITEGLTKGTKIGEDLFKYILNKTSGEGPLVIIAISSMLAAMEAQHPGTIDDIVEGANLFLNRLQEAMAQDMVNAALKRAAGDLN